MRTAHELHDAQTQLQVAQKAHTDELESTLIAHTHMVYPDVKLVELEYDNAIDPPYLTTVVLYSGEVTAMDMEELSGEAYLASFPAQAREELVALLTLWVELHLNFDNEQDNTLYLSLLAPDETSTAGGA